MTLTLRPYQRACVDAVYGHWDQGGGNALLCIPTGGGKSLVIAQLVREIRFHWPRLRIGIVTHVRELIAQNFQELMAIYPDCEAGIYSAGLGRRDTRAPVLFMGIQSVWNKTENFGMFDLILVDEAHLISRNAASMYGKFFASIRDRNPDFRVLGLTATPYRLDSGRLDKGTDKLFDKVIYDASVRDLIDDGFLSRLISKSTHAEISVEGVHKRGGEYIAGELERAAMSGDLVDRAAAEICQRGKDRRAWLAFCTGIDHATAVRDAIREHGFTAEQVDGSMAKPDRDQIIKDFRQGHIRCLTSVNVLSIGFNVPHVDLIALLRPTQSCGLYIQQVGRGFRLAPGKENCLVLDFAGNIRRHGPVDDVAPSLGDGNKGDKKEATEAPVKTCPACDSYMHPRVMVCADCGFEFPVPEKHEAKPDTVAILSEANGDEYRDVDECSYYRHVKRNDHTAPNTLRATYAIGLESVNAWHCFSHPVGGFAQRKAASWWIEAGGSLPVPGSVDDALARIRELKPVIAIRTKKNKETGFVEITGYRFGARDIPMKKQPSFMDMGDIPF